MLSSLRLTTLATIAATVNAATLYINDGYLTNDVVSVAPLDNFIDYTLVEFADGAVTSPVAFNSTEGDNTCVDTTVVSGLLTGTSGDAFYMTPTNDATDETLVYTPDGLTFTFASPMKYFSFWMVDFSDDNPNAMDSVTVTVSAYEDVAMTTLVQELTETVTYATADLTLADACVGGGFITDEKIGQHQFELEGESISYVTVLFHGMKDGQMVKGLQDPMTVFRTLSYDTVA